MSGIKKIKVMNSGLGVSIDGAWTDMDGNVFTALVTGDGNTAAVADDHSVWILMTGQFELVGEPDDL